MKIAILAIGAVIAAAMVPRLAAQNAPQIPVTVCEILASPLQFNGKDLAVLGRFRPTDEGWWLGEEDCGRKLVIDGYTWPNIVWIHCCYEPAPDPPSGSLVLDDAALAEKLKQVRRTTELKYQKRLIGHVFVKDGKVESTSEWRDVKEEWAVAYGRIETRSDLHPPTGSGPDRYSGNGFGHLDASPVQIVIKQKNLRRIPDEAPAGPNRQ